MVEDIHVLVLVPPDFDGRDDHPVLYLLHGGNQRVDCFLSHTDLIDFTAAQPADREAIIVMPYGGWSSVWVDWHSGKFHDETRFLETLIPTIEGRYGGVRPRNRRAAAGFSSGGWGALNLVARHPDRFAAAASLSGITDSRETTPFSLLAFGLEPYRPPYIAPLSLFGDPITNAVAWRDQSPLDLAPNFSTVDLTIFAGSGALCDARDVTDTVAFAPYAFLEPLATDYAARFHEGLDDAHVAHSYDAYGCGVHTYRYAERDLHEWWRVMFRALEADPPASFDHRRAVPSFEIYDWRFDADPLRAAEFLDVTDASCSGVTLKGSGTTSVTTAPCFAPGQAVRLSDGRLIDADGGGRITFRVDLGPPHRLQQYTAEQRVTEALWGSTYWVTRSTSWSLQ